MVIIWTNIERDQGIGIDMKEETGLGIFIKMNTETGLVKHIEKMIERIVEKKLMKETEDINLEIDISQVMIDGKMLTVAIVDLLQVQNLVLTWVKLEIVLDALNVYQMIYEENCLVDIQQNIQLNR